MMAYQKHRERQVSVPKTVAESVRTQSAFMALLAEHATIRSRDVLEPSLRNWCTTVAAVFATSFGIELLPNGSNRRHRHQISLILGKV